MLFKLASRLRIGVTGASQVAHYWAKTIFVGQDPLKGILKDSIHWVTDYLNQNIEKHKSLNTDRHTWRREEVKTLTSSEEKKKPRKTTIENCVKLICSRRRKNSQKQKTEIMKSENIEIKKLLKILRASFFRLGNPFSAAADPDHLVVAHFVRSTHRRVTLCVVWGRCDYYAAC